MENNIININRHRKESIDVVCIGMVTPAEVYVVEKLPDWNTGTKWITRADFISDDAAIVACCIAKWGLSSGLVCNKLGDDVLGRNVFDELEALGVVGGFLFPIVCKTSEHRKQRRWGLGPFGKATAIQCCV